jgi:hypothetical protein
MSAVFLFLQTANPGPKPARLVEATARYLPFQPEKSWYGTSESKSTHAWVWSVVDEAARGSYVANENGHILAYQGFIQEPEGAPLDVSVAQNLLTAAHKQGLVALTEESDGDYCAVHLDPEETLTAATDFVGGSHIYFGTRAGMTAVSNRAFMVAAALHGGTLPSPNPWFFPILHYTFGAPVGRETPWPDVMLLHPSEFLEVRSGRTRTVQRERLSIEDTLDFDWARDDFRKRVSQIKRFPDLTFKLTLTGGKDSRAVLAGLLMADALDCVTHTYLEANPTHPDVMVGKKLAKHYGLAFQHHEAGYGSEYPFMESIARHNFHTECTLNAWDRKGFDHKTRQGDLRGYYGEIYKSHEVSGLGLGWPIVKAVYGSRWFVDPQGIMTPEARRRTRDTLLSWAEGMRSSGLPARHAHNLIHRDCRMFRWVSAAQLWDATGPLSVNPIPGRRLFDFYLASPRETQKTHRFHFELIRGADDWLWRQPFANYQWERALLPADTHPIAPLTGSIMEADYRVTEWTDHAQEIGDYLLASHNAGAFFDLYSRKGLGKLLARAHREPTQRRIKAILGAVGIRHALTEPITPCPITFSQD